MKRSKWLAAALAVLLLAGCSLAQPEKAEQQGDRWVGFYVVPSQGYESDFYDNPNLEEYGSFQAETDQFGTLAFPQEVLFAVEDEAGNYTFPGLEKGYSLFVYREYGVGEPDHKGRNYAMGIVSNMGPGEEGPQYKYTDEGISETASGTVYFGPPPGVTDWDELTSGIIWRYYNVYQTQEGRIYLNGHGDSVNGAMSKTQTETRKTSLDGKTVQEETVSITVAIKTVPRLERLVATQFDENNAILQSDDLNLQNDRPELHCLPESAWVLVEEFTSGGTERTVYNPPEGEDPVSHEYVLLDEEGLGSMAYLNIYAHQPPSQT